MTREEILNYFRDINFMYNNSSMFDTLKRMLDELTEPCEDAVSRQAVLDGVDRYIYKTQSTGTQDDFYSFAELVVKALPSVTPKQKTGHWFIDERPESNRETICSVCEQPIFKYHKLDFDYRPAYCPNCGAKM